MLTVRPFPFPLLKGYLCLVLLHYRRTVLYTVYLFCLGIQLILAILEVPKFHVALFLQVVLAIPEDLYSLRAGKKISVNKQIY